MLSISVLKVSIVREDLVLLPIVEQVNIGHFKAEPQLATVMTVPKEDIVEHH